MIGIKCKSVKMKKPPHDMCDGLAGEEGFEPPWTVLETGILPLYDSPIWFLDGFPTDFESIA